MVGRCSFPVFNGSKRRPFVAAMGDVVWRSLRGLGLVEQRKMKLHELAHRIATDVQLISPPEYRLTLLHFVLDGLNEYGEPIAHSQHRIDMLRCLDCDKPASECPTCKEVSGMGTDRE
jgi:hypothetical protein